MLSWKDLLFYSPPTLLTAADASTRELGDRADGDGLGPTVAQPGELDPDADGAEARGDASQHPRQAARRLGPRGRVANLAGDPLPQALQEPGRGADPRFPTHRDEVADRRGH